MNNKTITLKEKNILKEKLKNILNTFEYINIDKIYLTLKENNIWPNINIFFTKVNNINNNYKYNERIFLTNYKYELTEQQLYNLLNKCETLIDIRRITPRANFDLLWIANNINY